jgi:ribosome maturation factor RimP
MSKGTLSPQVRSVIAEKLEENGIELYELEYCREQNGQILRIYIDTPHGVDTDTCILATRAVKEFIDTLDEFDYDYLEVSSPGIDRILKQDCDLLRFKGATVLVKTSQPVEGRKKFIGKLTAADPSTLSIEIEGQPVHLNRELITIVRLHPDI